jgi:hypothetical protein
MWLEWWTERMRTEFGWGKHMTSWYTETQKHLADVVCEERRWEKCLKFASNASNIAPLNFSFLLIEVSSELG